MVGIDQSGRVLELVVLVFDGGGELLIHAVKAHPQFLDELVQLAGGYPLWPWGMVCESWNQASLEESGADSNAPYGARCFLTWSRMACWMTFGCRTRLNAPYGARCFLTSLRRD